MSAEIMVSVICTTYNHGRYIRKCLESLVSQKTNFAYEIIVHDDCSTDNTAEIIHEFELQYPDKIKPVYRKENLYSKGIRPAYAASQFAKGYYLTHCEGDDYWCDDEKLQLQFDYMQNHNDCSLCFHNTYTYYDDTGVTEDNWIFWKDRKYKGAGIYTSDELVELNVVPLSSIMYRSKDNDDIDLTSKLVKYGDIAKTLWLADKGYGYCMARTMSVYRRNANESAMTKVYGSVDQYNKGILATVETFENFDNYTNHRFAHIIAPKISELKRKYLSVDMEKLADCVSKDKETYIFGTGVYAMLCSAEMSKNNIDYTGFVVSDGQKKSENFKEHPVKYISEVTDPSALIIPAVGANVLAIIKENLNDLGFYNVCEVCKEGLYE